MRKINKIILHCSATPPTMDIGVNVIREWHLDRGFTDVGYHWVIMRNGTLEKGRPEVEMGAHAKGHNEDSVGVCLVGGVNDLNEPDANYTLAQYSTLSFLFRHLKLKYNNPAILGHRDLSGTGKACPCVDATALAANL